MRIVSGSLKGRVLRLPESDRLRPTSERVREAIFSVLFSLQDPEGLTVLDLFAGSGALGIEALSRGARSLTFVEKENLHVAALRENVLHFEIAPSCRIIQSSVDKWLAGGSLSSPPFDLVFIDPPYESHPGEQLLKDLLSRRLFSGNAIVVVESDRKLTLPEFVGGEPSGLRLLKMKEYGTTRVHFFRCELSAGVVAEKGSNE